MSKETNYYHFTSKWQTLCNVQYKLQQWTCFCKLTNNIKQYFKFLGPYLYYLYLAVNLCWDLQMGTQSRLKDTISHHMLMVTHFNPAPIKWQQIAFPDLKAWRACCCHGSHFTAVPRWGGEDEDCVGRWSRKEWETEWETVCCAARCRVVPSCQRYYGDDAALPFGMMCLEDLVGWSSHFGVLNQDWQEASQEKSWERLLFQNHQTGNATVHLGFYVWRCPLISHKAIWQISHSPVIIFSDGLSLAHPVPVSMAGWFLNPLTSC